MNGSFQDGVDQLKDGKIDAAFTVAGAPTTAIVDYATTNTLNLISLTDEELAAIQEAYPFLIRDDLPSTTYTGMTGDVVCVAIQATLVASKDLSEDVVYELLKAMFDNKDALTEGHAKFGFLDPEAASAGATVTMQDSDNVAILIHKDVTLDKKLEIFKEAKELRQAGKTVTIQMMRKNMKQQINMLESEGYTEFKKVYND